jgi:tetratricopeptide (TPR) repeat protein
VATAADIEGLIEDGLNRYGSGELDGALAIWEEVLAIDPDNAQANSYVDYVRTNYEVLQAGGGADMADESVPFGIEAEPEYIIEITRGHELPEAPAPMYMDPLDQGWFIEEETHQVLAARTRSNALVPRTRSAEQAPVIEPPSPTERPRAARDSEQVLELEADEPPEGDRGSTPAISFDTATREYGEEHRSTAPADPLDESNSFKPEPTPLGFGNIETEIKKRNLGFVQPAQGSVLLAVRMRTPSSIPPNVTVPVAKASMVEPAMDGGAESSALAVAGGNYPNTDLLTTSHGIPVTRMPGPSTAAMMSEAELLSSLPSPRRTTPVRGSTNFGPVGGSRETKPAAADHERAETKRGDEIEDITLSSAPTRELDGLPGHLGSPPSPSGFMDDFSISAPTRDIGLRPGGRPPSVFPDDEVPTRQNDARQIRAAHASQQHPTIKQQLAAAEDSTRMDVVLPFDPIDAGSASILDEIDLNEPPNEAKEDRTRRRISALIERATVWSSQLALDKAATAVDLALSEDPNSALAQKLIHRNRDAIMAIFQSYLGNLDRQPQLARPLHELASTPISPRAAFLLSRIDGMLTIDEILDVSGMPRLEAYRHLTQLFLRGILR